MHPPEVIPTAFGFNCQNTHQFFIFSFQQNILKIITPSSPVFLSTYLDKNCKPILYVMCSRGDPWIGRVQKLPLQMIVALVLRNMGNDRETGGDLDFMFVAVLSCSGFDVFFPVGDDGKGGVSGLSCGFVSILGVLISGICFLGRYAANRYSTAVFSASLANRMQNRTRAAR